jgi:hypothetical protein
MVAAWQFGSVENGLTVPVGVTWDSSSRHGLVSVVSNHLFTEFNEFQ